MASPDYTEGGVLLSLRFKPKTRDDPRPEEVASLLKDMEGLYRAVPAASALGVPVVELLAAYHVARAESAAGRLPADPYGLRPWLSLPEVEEFLFWTRTRRRRRDYEYRPGALLPPEHAMRVQHLSMGSPLDLLASIPPEYWRAGGFALFLKAIELYFNIPERIRTERIDLKARQTYRRADEREAEVREERAARELEGLRREGGPFTLVKGEVLPADERDETRD
jgi:hypothetical protein